MASLVDCRLLALDNFQADFICVAASPDCGIDPCRQVLLFPPTLPVAIQLKKSPIILTIIQSTFFFFSFLLFSVIIGVTGIALI